MPVNGVRVLPDIPKSSVLGGDNFVKKMIEAYEMKARWSNENNRISVEKSTSSPAICNASGSQCRSSFKKIPKIASRHGMHEIEDDGVKWSSENDGAEILEVWLGSSPKINMYSSVDELSTDVQCSTSRRNKMWKLIRKNQKQDKTKNELMICSSPLEKNKYLDTEDSFDDVSTSSYDSSSSNSNSYKKLQDDLYSFDNDQQTLPYEDRPIEMALTEKLSQNKPLQKFKSAFTTKWMHCKKAWKKSTEKSSDRNSESQFVFSFPSSQKSWRPGPTFETFGYKKSGCFNVKACSKDSHMVLTEVPREEFASGFGFSDSVPWKTRRDTAGPSKENHANVESSRLKDPCGYPTLVKHPCLTRNGIFKHPFVPGTKLD
ncbi:hypothetical protein PUN28_014422 [Cardiocondyla obscurior]|uniref:Uncharacterized protein n=1 Tax=Cardiocondyla obscurior TaxID=286306 RepID=A0AAW2F1B8_9HYME